MTHNQNDLIGLKIISEFGKGTIRFIGPTSFKAGIWVGVELDSPSGKNDGSVQGIRYFSCEKTNGKYGLFMTKGKLDNILAQSNEDPNVNSLAMKPPSLPPPSRNNNGRTSISPSTMNRASTIASTPTRNIMRSNSISRSNSVLNHQSNRRDSRIQFNDNNNLNNSIQRETSLSRSRASSRISNVSISTPKSSRMSLSNNMSPIAFRGRNVSPIALRGVLNPLSPEPPTPTRKNNNKSIYMGSNGLPLRTGSVSEMSEEVLTNSSKISLTDNNQNHEPEPELQSPTSSPFQIQPRSQPVSSPTPSPVEQTLIVSTESSTPVVSTPASITSFGLPSTPDLQTTSVPSTPPVLSSVSISPVPVSPSPPSSSPPVLVSTPTPSTTSINSSSEGHLKKVISKLQEKLKTMHDNITTLQSEKSEYEKLLTNSTTQISNYEHEFEIATIDKEMAEEKTEHLEEDLKILQLKYNKLNKECESLKEELSLTNDIANINDKSDDIIDRKDLTDYEKIQSLHQRCNLLESTLIKMHESSELKEEELILKIKNLEEELTSLSDELPELKDADKKLKDAENIISELQQELEASNESRDMIEVLSSQNFELSTKCEELMKSNEELEELIKVNDDLEADHILVEEELQNEIKDLTNQINNEKNTIEMMERKNVFNETTISSLRSNINILQKDIDHLTRQQIGNSGDDELNSNLNSNQIEEISKLKRLLQNSIFKSQSLLLDYDISNSNNIVLEQKLEILKSFIFDLDDSSNELINTIIKLKSISLKSKVLINFINININNNNKNDNENFNQIDNSISSKVKCFVAIAYLYTISSICEFLFYLIENGNNELIIQFNGLLTELNSIDKSLSNWVIKLKNQELVIDSQMVNLKEIKSIIFGWYQTGLSYNNDIPGFIRESYISKISQSWANMNSSHGIVEIFTNVLEHFSKSNQEKGVSIYHNKLMNLLKDLGFVKKALYDLMNQGLKLRDDKLELIKENEEGFDFNFSNVFQYVAAVGLGLCQHFDHVEQNETSFSVVNYMKLFDENSSFLSSSKPTMIDSKDSLDTLHSTITKSLSILQDILTRPINTESIKPITNIWKIKSDQIKEKYNAAKIKDEEIEVLKYELVKMATQLREKDKTIENLNVKAEVLELKINRSEEQETLLSTLRKQLNDAEIIKEELEVKVAELLRASEEQQRNLSKVSFGLQQQANIMVPVFDNIDDERNFTEKIALVGEIKALRSTINFLSTQKRDWNVNTKDIEWLKQPLTKSKDDLKRCGINTEYSTKTRVCFQQLQHLSADTELIQIKKPLNGSHRWRRKASIPIYYSKAINERYQKYELLKMELIKN